MSKIKIAGVKRNTQYSPNHIGNDGKIFNLVAENLRDMGCQVDEFTEAEFILYKGKIRHVFNLARDKTTIKHLQKLEREGATVVNSGFGIDNCARKNMTKILVQHLQ